MGIDAKCGNGMKPVSVGLTASILCLAISNCTETLGNINTDTDTDADAVRDSETENDFTTGGDSDRIGGSGIDTDFDTDFIDSNWTREIVGTYSRFYEIKIGDARNDGVNRLYSAGFNGNLIEWSFVINGTWEKRYCGGVTDNVDEVENRLIGIWIGPGRNDGINRIYAADVNGDTYEFSYNQSLDEWEMIAIGLGNFQTGIVVGDVRNDGVTRVVSTGFAVSVTEYFWKGGAWMTTAVSDGPRNIWPPSLGSARNDGYNRLYCPDWGAPYLREYSWNGAGFEEQAIETFNKLVKTVTGDGRNDGIQRVYASEMMGHVIEFSAIGNGEWEQLDILAGQEANHSRYGLYLGKTHTDTANRIYSVAQGGRLREHSFENDAWANTVIDAVSGATADLTVGNGRNDNINRLYVAGSNGVLFEYTRAEFAQ